VQRQVRVLPGARVHVRGHMRPTWRSGVLVLTYNDAEDALWPRGSRLLLGLFALRKVLLFHEAGLSFASGLYAEGGGGVEGV
jgi:hypothetical protein